MTRVINFAAGPGAGKSTLAGQLFGWMKSERINCEYVTEFAKDLTWKKSGCIDDQLYILGEQFHRQYVLLGQCDYIITDSPIFLSMHYIDIGFSKIPKDSAFWEEFADVFKKMALHAFESFDNTTFFVDRWERKYLDAGRNQTEAEARGFDENIKILMHNYQIPYFTVRSFDDVVEHMTCK